MKVTHGYDDQYNGVWEKAAHNDHDDHDDHDDLEELDGDVNQYEVVDDVVEISYGHDVVVKCKDNLQGV